MYPALSVFVAFTTVLAVCLVARWTTRRNANQGRLDRGLRGYISAVQR